MNRRAPAFLRWLTCLWRGACSVLPFVSAAAAGVAETEERVALDRVTASAGSWDRAGDVLPQSRPVLSVYGAMPLLDVSRAVTVLTPELLRQAEIRDSGALGRVGAGTQQTNFYGVPGAPTLRGAKAGVFFNGQARAWQRNEMPLSFGALDAIDLVKGATPAHLGASLVGGYANLIPKSPSLNGRRGWVRAEIGENAHRQVQLDYGAPVATTPGRSAYRVALTVQSADSAYDRIGHDYASAYVAWKTEFRDASSLLLGTEFFRYRSNENAGWNRPTQALINSGRYVIGEPLSIVPVGGAAADRSLLNVNRALVVPTATVDAGVQSGFITAAQRAALLDLADPAQRAIAYGAFAPAALAGIQPSTSGYQYTPAYFAAGGRVFTAPIAGGRVLSDSADYADSTNVLAFADFTRPLAGNRSWRAQGIVDALRTDKLSTYGYAIFTEQLATEAKLSLHDEFDWLGAWRVVVGGSARLSDAKMLQDFFDEPFSRRDVSRTDVSANSRILAGAQRGADGRNFWSPTALGGANVRSRLGQFSVFGYGEHRATDWLATHTSLQLTHAPYTIRYPDEVDRVPAGDPRRTAVRGERNYAAASLGPVLSLGPAMRLYGTVQRATTVDPLQGGAIVNGGNFARSELLEAGAKFQSAGGRVFAALSAYRWNQTAFDQRTNRAEPLVGRGLELEVAWQPWPSLSILAAANHQRVERRSPLGFRSIPLSEQEWALYAGALTSNFAGIRNEPFGRPAANPDLRYPGTPETQMKVLVTAKLPGRFTATVNTIWSDAYWHNFDRTLRLPARTVTHARLAYVAPRYEIALAVENLFNTDYFLGAEPLFGANTLITKAPPRAARLSFARRF